MTKAQIIEKINNVKTVQGKLGNWDANEYMRGYYNGIELCAAIAENRQAIFRGTKETTAKQRVEKELKELSEKTKGLSKFLNTIAFNNLKPEMKGLLKEQELLMAHYILILEKRLKTWEV